MTEMQKLREQWETASRMKDTLTMRRVQQDMRRLLMKEADKEQPCSNQQ